jgi:hypothetical protein
MTKVLIMLNQDNKHCTPRSLCIDERCIWCGACILSNIENLAPDVLMCGACILFDFVHPAPERYPRCIWCEACILFNIENLAPYVLMSGVYGAQLVFYLTLKTPVPMHC